VTVTYHISVRGSHALHLNTRHTVLVPEHVLVDLIHMESEGLVEPAVQPPLGDIISH
jgi:hypothetical protein